MMTSLVAAWLLPPQLPLIVVLAGLYMLRTRLRAGRALIVGGTGLLLVWRQSASSRHAEIRPDAGGARERMGHPGCPGRGRV
jgi:hypothetical protein